MSEVLKVVAFIACVAFLGYAIHRWGKSSAGTKVVNKIENEDDGA